MRIEKPVNSLSTYIVIDAVDMVTDHQRRYYAVPRDYRMSENPQEGDPSFAYSYALEGHTDSDAYKEALNLLSLVYWKILADDAEANYKSENP